MSGKHVHIEEPGPSELRSPLVQNEIRRASVWIGMAVAVALLVLLAQPIMLKRNLPRSAFAGSD